TDPAVGARSGHVYNAVRRRSTKGSTWQQYSEKAGTDSPVGCTSSGTTDNTARLARRLSIRHMDKRTKGRPRHRGHRFDSLTSLGDPEAARRTQALATQLDRGNGWTN